MSRPRFCSFYIAFQSCIQSAFLWSIETKFLDLVHPMDLQDASTFDETTDLKQTKMIIE